MAAASSMDPPKKLPRKQVAKKPFKTPNALPRHQIPIPPDQEEDRVDFHVVQPARIPNQLRHVATSSGLTFKPELPDSFKHAVERQGRPSAEKVLRHAANSLSKKGVKFGTGGFDGLYADQLKEDGQEKKLVSRPYSDQQLRQAFLCFDLDGNDYVDAAELRHIFAQIGELPTDNEISAMIVLCDPRGDGTVNFDDFLNVFSNPAESLRNANLKGLKHLLPRKKVDFDIRDPLGLALEERTRLKVVSLVVVEVRKGSQAQDAGVKCGWKLVILENEPVKNEKEFEAKLKIIEGRSNPAGAAKQDESLPGKKGKGKGKQQEPEKKQPIKYDYSLVFEVLPGTGEESSSEEMEEEAEEEEEDEDEEEDD